MPNLKLSCSTMLCPQMLLTFRQRHSILLGLAVSLCAPGSAIAFEQIPSDLGRGQKNPNFIEEKLKAIVTEFGADAEQIPKEFLEEVRRWARLYQTRDRCDMARVLGPERERFEAVRKQLGEADLPPDLAFLMLVESDFKSKNRSKGGNAGLWQFERATARHNGLQVNAKVDERLDPQKSTAAACRYFSRLRRIFGSEASLLLMVAAYNLGPSRLQARMKSIRDPDLRNDFWHLYSTRVVPALTRTHIARLLAAILIGRHEEDFGFAASNQTGNAKLIHTPDRAISQGAENLPTVHREVQVPPLSGTCCQPAESDQTSLPSP